MFQQVSQLLQTELDKGTFPGGVVAIVNQEGLVYKEALGYAQLEPEKRELREDTVFGLASLTKVLATTSAVMKLIEEGQLNLWDYLREYYPQLPKDKDELTIYHLLTHTSGYQAIVQMWEMELSYQEKIEYILDLALENEIDQVVTYSDPNFILLGDLVKRVSGLPLDRYVREKIFGPLGMETTDFNPLDNLPDLDKEDYAATEYCSWRDRMIIGEVHDENCYSLAGVTGHAGLFSTIDDLAIFMEMLLNDGIYRGVRIFSPRTIQVMSRPWTKGMNQNRGLGWDLRDNFRSSGGVLMSEKAYGHTGFTGTSFWVDPELKLGVIFLTNRVHPSRENKQIISLRPRLHNLITTIYTSINSTT